MYKKDVPGSPDEWAIVADETIVGGGVVIPASAIEAMTAEELGKAVKSLYDDALICHAEWLCWNANANTLLYQIKRDGQREILERERAVIARFRHLSPTLQRGFDVYQFVFATIENRERAKRLRKQLSHTRKEIYQALARRDGEYCADCYSPQLLQIDHVKPLSEGGTNAMQNLRLLCQRCNQERGHEAARKIHEAIQQYS